MGSDFDRNVYIVAMVTSSLSCVGCFVVFAAWILLKDTRSTGRRLLLFLTTADLLTAVGNLIGASWALELSSSGRSYLNSSEALNRCHNPDGICVFQSFLSTVGSLASFFWTMLIAWQVRETLVGERSSWMDKAKYQWLLHLLAWGVPVFILTAAAADDKLGYWQSSENHTSFVPKTTTMPPNMSMAFLYHVTAYPSLDGTKPRQDNTVVVAVDGHAENSPFEGGGYSGSKENLLRGSTAGWCWIKICEGDESQWGLVVFLTLLTGKGWEMVAYLVVPTIYFNIKGKLQRTVLKASASRLDKAVLEAVKKAHRAMTAVPLMFIALRIWGTIRYVANITVWITGLPTEPWFELVFNKIFLVLHAIGDSGQGLGNSLIYCLLADRVRDNIFRHLCASCCWRRPTGLRYSLNLPRDTSMYDESRNFTISEDTTTSHSGSESETSENTPILRQKYDLYS